jgi:hypothetical protein
MPIRLSGQTLCDCDLNSLLEFKLVNKVLGDYQDVGLTFKSVN